MSRIDDALRRLTGGVSSEPRKPHSLDGFASEGEVSHKADESRRQTRIEPRKVAALVVATPAPVEQRASAPAAPAPAPAVAVEAPVQRPAARVVERVDVDTDADKLIDVRQVADYAGFVVRSIGRHKMLTAATFLGVLLVAALVAWLFPRSYRVEVKLLAQRNAVMTALSNPNRTVPWDADAPTRAAAETVLRRDNLISLISQTDLINEWDRRRPLVTRVKDWVIELVTRYEMTPEDKLDVLVWRLENYMTVEAGPVGDGTVTITLDWPDAQMAYRIAERARQAFIEARQQAETSAITESISILEGYSQELHEKVNKTLSSMGPRGGRAAAEAPRVTAPRPRRPVPLAPTLDAFAAPLSAPGDGPSPNPELSRMAAQLRDKQEELNRLEAERQVALSTAQATLAAFKASYTNQHPSVQNAQQKVDALSGESPQVAALKKQVDELEIRYEALTTADRERIEQESAKQRPARATASRVAAAPTEAYDEPAPAPRVNPSSEFANLTLRTELNQLQSFLERTDGARIELLVSEAAFKYRYTVIKPAQVPREPESPNLRLMAIAGLLAAILLSVGAAVAKDVFSNRIVEAWQVERQLGLPILGNVRLA